MQLANLPGVWPGDSEVPIGPTLRELLDAGAAISPLDAAGICNEVGQTVLALARAGWCHDALSADSIVPGTDGITRLADVEPHLRPMADDCSAVAAWADLVDQVAAAWGGQGKEGFHIVAEAGRHHGMSRALVELGALARALPASGVRRDSIRAAVSQYLADAATRAPLPPAVTSVTHLARRRDDANRESAVGEQPAPKRTSAAEIRFGPGVPAAARADASVAAAPVRRPLRRAQGALLFIGTAALAALLWWWLHRTQPLEVSAVTPVAVDAVLGCDQTADLSVTVRTNGEPGVIEYRWLRSDGTQSPVLVERLADGQYAASLVLHWKVVGRGTFHGQASAVITAPQPLTTSVGFDYICR
jgi:hypothetical protein